MNQIRRSEGYPLGLVGRVLLGLWSLFLAAGFATAVSLEPDARGFGTHQRLGLPPCSFRVMFGIPCPSCGMTTSFSNVIRGRFIDAARANVAGLMLAVVCLAMIPWSWRSVWTGRLWKIDNPDTALLWLLLAICGAALLQWAVRLTI